MAKDELNTFPIKFVAETEASIVDVLLYRSGVERPERLDLNLGQRTKQLPDGRYSVLMNIQGPNDTLGEIQVSGANDTQVSSDGRITAESFASIPRPFGVDGGEVKL